MKSILAIFLCLGVLMSNTSAHANSGPIVIGHRGAPGYLPEHTMESYRLAIRQGADFIEPDLVSTKDGVLICRHENEISGTTDVAEKFPDRKTTKLIDGEKHEGWFTEDFTLAEIKTLRAKERLPFRSHENNGKYLIPTLDEVLTLAREARVGVYPETKHPSYFQSIALPLEERLVELLKKHGYTKTSDPVFIQSFEPSNLQKLNKMTEVKLVQLLHKADARRVTTQGLKEIAEYADGIGPEKQMILASKDLVANAHAAGLVVHPYTFRADQEFLAKEYKGDPLKEYLRFYELGVDGVFSDFPDLAVKARKAISKPD